MPGVSNWRAMARSVPLFAVFLAFVACSEVPPFDSVGYLRSRVAEQLGTGAAAAIEIPFELESEILALVDARLRPAGSERRRARQVVDLVFGHLGLEYAYYPTRTANETFRARQGNCLSFVNLFVALGRHVGLNPFYVEVVDQRGWSYQQGMVVSRGHIVAGMRLDGNLETFDFLPYQPKSYRDLEPLDDRRAVAHFYNNLGAEALLAGDLPAARKHLDQVGAIAPDFVGGMNNLGVCLARLGELEEALLTYRRGLDLEPSNVAVMSNAARLYQQLGYPREAEVLLARIRDTRQASPFFYVYQGELALAENDFETALKHLREALRIDSEVPEVHLGLVKLHLALGEVARARHHLSRALKLDPTHPDADPYRQLLTEYER